MINLRALASRMHWAGLAGKINDKETEPNPSWTENNSKLRAYRRARRVKNRIQKNSRRRNKI